MDAPIPHLKLAREIDQACDRFEEAWRSGARPRIESFLEPVASRNRPSFLRELLRLEVEFRREVDDQSGPAEYLTRFPDCRSLIEEIFSQLPFVAPGVPVRDDNFSLSVDEFLDVLLSLPLLDAAQQRQVADLRGQGGDLKTIENDFIRLGLLTSYQANQIARGCGNDLVLDQYVLLDLLGQGGMGVVYKARQQRMQRFVAVKLIRREALNLPGAIERFQREALAIARLAHPNIVTVFDTNQVKGVHFLVMEYLDGIDLAKLVKEKGPLPVGFACDCIRQAALGLQHAHEQGLIHRDIKPHNLMLSKQGVVKVMDLGLARTAPSSAASGGECLTLSGAVLGTPDYIAPEQALNAMCVDIRADVYSLGCSLYHLLTGRTPFAGGTMTEKLIKHQLEEPEPVEQLRTGIPKELPTIVRKMMAKKAERRYQTPADVAKALEALGQTTSDSDHWSIAGLGKEPPPGLRSPTIWVRAILTPRETPVEPLRNARKAELAGGASPFRTGRRMGLALIVGLASVLLAAVSIPRSLFSSAKPVPSEALGTPPRSATAPRSWPENRANLPTSGRSNQMPPEAAQRPSKHGPVPREPSKDVIDAWKTAGARYGGWLFLKNGRVSLQRNAVVAQGDLPGFVISRISADTKLLDPGVPFALEVEVIDDTGLKELAGLKSLQMLYLNNTPVSDEGLKELAGLQSLQALGLNNTWVSDVGLKELTSLKALRMLDLTNTRVSDVGLKGLTSLTALQTLGLIGTQATDTGLKELAKLQSLQMLELGATHVTDAGLKELAGLKSLQWLDLNLTQVTDVGLKELAGLKSLQTLHLGYTKTSDAGLKELAGLEALQTLGLTGTKVSDAGISKLKKALPNCEIFR